MSELRAHKILEPMGPAGAIVLDDDEVAILSSAKAFPVVVATVFVVTSYFAWERMIEAPEDQVFAGGLERAWIDEHVPHDVPVTKLYMDTSCGSALEGHALYLTEYFNSTVDRGAFIGSSAPDGLPSERVDVAPLEAVGRGEARPLAHPMPPRVAITTARG